MIAEDLTGPLGKQDIVSILNEFFRKQEVRALASQEGNGWTFKHLKLRPVLCTTRSRSAVSLDLESRSTISSCCLVSPSPENLTRDLLDYGIELCHVIYIFIYMFV